MKIIAFFDESLEVIKDFALKAKRDLGHKLDRIQRDGNSHDWKPMKSIGTGVREIRGKDEKGIFRVVYVVRCLDRVHVLHAFQKKTILSSVKI